MATTDDTRPDVAFDEVRAAEFAGRLFDIFTSAMVTLSIDLASRTGLLEVLAQGAGTSGDIATRGGLQERYVRECLGALVTACIADYDAESGTYIIPAEHAFSLTGAGSGNIAPLSRISTLLAQHVAGVAEAFRTGGGVPYEDFRPDFTDVMDGMSRGFFDEQLVDGVLPLAGDLPAQLSSGIRVADIGCGTGHSTNVLARAFPASVFTGYDLATDAIERARAEAAEYGLTNVSFAVRDVATLPAAELDAVFAFDAIHDQADPAAVLAGIYTALVPGGVFAMFDIKAATRLEDNIGNPFAPFIYATSTLHCLTVSLAQGGAGLGAAWGTELAADMLASAGFVNIAIHDVPDDPIDCLYVACKPST